MIKAYFEDIHVQIIHLLEGANSEIKICVAWFTDYEIYTTLIKKRKEGIKIDVILANHKFNKSSKVDFKEFLILDGTVNYIGNIENGKRDSLMHNKFCVIDRSIVITGSYNWSYKARKNEENILVIKDEERIAIQFLEKFTNLKPKYGFALKNNKVTLLPLEKIMKKWDKAEVVELQPQKKIVPPSSIWNKF